MQSRTNLLHHVWNRCLCVCANTELPRWVLMLAHILWWIRFQLFQKCHVLMLSTKFMTQFKLFARLFRSNLLLIWEKWMCALVYPYGFFWFRVVVVRRYHVNAHFTYAAHNEKNNEIVFKNKIKWKNEWNNVGFYSAGKFN